MCVFGGWICALASWEGRKIVCVCVCVCVFWGDVWWSCEWVCFIPASFGTAGRGYSRCTFMMHSNMTILSLWIQNAYEVAVDNCYQKNVLTATPFSCSQPGTEHKCITVQSLFCLISFSCFHYLLLKLSLPVYTHTNTQTHTLCVCVSVCQSPLSFSLFPFGSTSTISAHGQREVLNQPAQLRPWSRNPQMKSPIL